MPKVTKSSGSRSRVDPLARPEVPNFTCCSCMEEYTAHPVMVHGDSTCVQCFKEGIVPQFHDALQNEVSYPVRYGREELPIDTYTGHFDRAFILSWREKVAERRFLPADRLYCAGKSIAAQRCNKFLGDKNRHRSTQRCSECNSMTCADCDRQITVVPHTCPDRDANDANPLEGQVRGRQYQLCPSCNTAVTLQDGCNHMTCRVPSCQAHFCYLCGIAARPPGHWNVPGGCPQYGIPGGNMDPIHNQQRPGWMDYALLRPYGNWALQQVAGMPNPNLPAADPLALARTRLNVVAQAVHARAVESPEGLLMANHLTAMLDILETFQDLGNARIPWGEFPWLWPACELAMLLRNTLGMYVRRHISLFGFHVGEDHWVDRLPIAIPRIEALAQQAGPQAFAVFPGLAHVLAGWRLAARGDYAELAALPLIDHVARGERAVPELFN